MFKKVLSTLLASMGAYPVNLAQAEHAAKLERVNNHSYPLPKKRGKFKPYSRQMARQK